MGATLQSILASCEGEQVCRGFPRHVWEAAWRLRHCRTAVLGQHAAVCENGHVEGVWYNSCRHRSCPQCSWRETERWLAGVRERLLPCAHHHVIFTLPHELLPFWRWNRRGLADLLFRVAWDTLATLLGEDRYLGGRSGMIAAFQSWSETLAEHPHLHCIVPRVGWDPAQGLVEAKKSILLPARAVKSLFRGKFLGALEKSLLSGALEIPTHLRARGWRQLLRHAARKKWNVRIQPAYVHADGVARYLARYMRGGPIKNHRLEELDGERVTLRTRPSDGGSPQRLRLEIGEFLRRVFCHIPEPGFRAVRAYGIYHHHLREILEALRSRITGRPVRPIVSLRERIAQQWGNPKRCSRCGTALRHVDLSRWGRSPPDLHLLHAAS